MVTSTSAEVEVDIALSPAHALDVRPVASSRARGVVDVLASAAVTGDLHVTCAADERIAVDAAQIVPLLESV